MSDVTMCILFIYNGTNDEQSDYKMILISNRDEQYDRPTQNMTYWSKDPIIIAGRDLQAKDDSTWLAVSPTYKKIGVLLNLLGFNNENALNVTMCILFIYNGTNDEQSDYKMILISNRDEQYDRPTQNMTYWSKDPIIIAGRDLQAKDDSTWLAVSPTYKKIGVLLNLLGFNNENALSRGNIVANYVKNDNSIQKYVENIKTYSKNCNGFVFVSVEFSALDVSVYSYNNINDQLTSHNDAYLGFGNSLPNTPLKKVTVGQTKLEEICSKFNKQSMEKNLVENLIELLKSEECHLSDEELQTRQPNMYNELSSIYVRIPKVRYGTRTHTIVILTKTDHLRITELTQQMPINPIDPIWEKAEFNYVL